MLTDEIKEVCASSESTPSVRRRFLDRLEEGALTRDENPISHYCVYFLPYNEKEKTVFIVHHKKSGLWLAPGGHIDKGENLLHALVREIGEELGFQYMSHDAKPFMLTITEIPDTPKYACRTHYDSWYGIPTDGSEFNVNPEEFHETRWLTVPEARKLVTDPVNLEAIARIETLFSEVPVG